LGFGETTATAAPTLELHTQEFVDSLAGAPPIYTLSPAAARAVLTRAQSIPVGKPSAQIEDISLPVGPADPVPIRIVRPTGTTEILPVVMYFHVGGWVLGDRDTHDRLIREIAVGAGAAVVFVDYARAPEVRYPTAIEQAYAATCYVAENGAGLHIDPLRLAVAGDSVGGNMAAAITLMARQRRGPKIAFQVLFYPVTDARFDSPFYRRFADGPWLTRRAMEWFWDAYLPDPTARKQPTATPLSSMPRQTSSPACPKRSSLSTRTTCCATKARLTPASCQTRAFGLHRCGTTLRSTIS
jgi:acetyl esterase